jgi:hypothetical protein
MRCRIDTPISRRTLRAQSCWRGYKSEAWSYRSCRGGLEIFVQTHETEGPERVRLTRLLLSRREIAAALEAEKGDAE